MPLRDAAARQILVALAKRRPVVAESQRNIAAEAATLLRSFYYPKQGAFFTGPAKRKATSKTRRAGATTGGCIELLARALERPGFRATIVHSTKVEARNRAWLSDTKSGLVDLLRKYGTPVEDPSIEVIMIGGVRAEIRDQVMTIDFSNGSKIDLFGFDDERAMRKQRGLAKHVYWIDEAQDIRFLDKFYDAVVMAALADYKGECWLSGTPGQDCAGMFYEITKDTDDGPRMPGWDVHTMAVVDNPRFGRVVTDTSSGWLTYFVEDDNEDGKEPTRTGPFATYFEAEKAAETVRWDRTAGAALKEKGWKGDEPDFIREWLGRWSKKDARFVYPVHTVSPHDLLYAVERRIPLEKVAYQAVNNEMKRIEVENHADPVTGKPPYWCDFNKAISDLPKLKRYNRIRQWMYAVGVDFGYSPDPLAIVVWAFSHDSRDVYELFSWKATKVHTDDQGLYLLKVWTSLTSIVAFVGDPAGKQDDFEVWRNRLNLPIDEANKRGKNTLEEFLAADIRKGVVHLRLNSPLHDEMKHLQYLPTKPGKTREVAKYRRAGDNIVHGDHCCDAGRYAYAELTHFLSTLPKEAADKGTVAALAEEAEKIETRMDTRESKRAAAMADGDEAYLDSIGEYDT